MGDEKGRYGSVSLSLRKLAKGVGKTYMHWVALYDFLGEDQFDGLLGEDDWEYPRILLEYSVIGGKFTSVVNNLEQVKETV